MTRRCWGGRKGPQAPRGVGEIGQELVDLLPKELLLDHQRVLGERGRERAHPWGRGESGAVLKQLPPPWGDSVSSGQKGHRLVGRHKVAELPSFEFTKAQT